MGAISFEKVTGPAMVGRSAAIPIAPAIKNAAPTATVLPIKCTVSLTDTVLPTLECGSTPIIGRSGLKAQWTVWGFRGRSWQKTREFRRVRETPRTFRVRTGVY